MNDLTDEGALETSWRNYYENPLTVATNAMLHINGAEEQTPVSVIYQENFKEQPGIPATTVGGALEIKLTNGSIEGVPGAGHVESIFLQGGAEVVKREPEDLTRKCISPVERIVLSDKRRPVLLQGTPQSDSPPALIPTQNFKDEFEPAVKDEERHRVNHTIIIQAPLDSGDKMSAGSYLSSFPSASPQSNYEPVPYLAPSPQPYATSTSPVIRGSPAVYSSAEPYYREYYQVSEPQYASLRQEYSATEVLFDRYTRPAPSYKQILTVDSSPDSGISSDTVPTRDQPLSLPQQQAFPSYEDISQQPTIITTDLRPVTVQGSPGAQRSSPSTTPGANARSWHDFSRHSEGDKIQIPKIQSDDDKIHIEKIDNPYGFKFYLESPISTSPRREDDRITYINKGQFYAITMEYIPDPERHLKPGTVKSIVMLMFREEKSAEDESKAWHFWHGRQHSVKQRILDVDTKNSVGLVGCIEEISHNAICVYWNPLESSAKINIAVQCLSTDFSSQKGVKGLPLHIQIDTYDDPRDSGVPVFHRAYCQIKVFCDKGAERKTRDEERRAQKRRINPSTRKKYEDLYHAPCDRSEFYSMADLMKEPVFFKPNEDIEKVAYMNSMDMPGTFYNHEAENGEIHKDLSGAITNGNIGSNMEEMFSHAHKRTRLTPPMSERVMLFVRREGEELYTPLHLVPPGTLGLINAIEQKFQIPRTNIKSLCRKNKAGIRARIDDDMLRHYCNEDCFIIDIQRRDQDAFEITLIELTNNRVE